MLADPLLGELVDRRFRVLKRLGTGGMGSVYLAEHLNLSRRFAVKVLRQEFNEQPEFLARFLRESRAASEIDHPNVIEVLDTGTLADGRAYYVMEYLQGEDLLHTLRDQVRLPWRRVRHMAVQICEGLAAAHARGMVHRDLKPANCFRVTRGGDPDFIKLLDFGIVKLLEDGARLTGTGALLGTAHYMAPEQVMGLAIDHRVDIYALGVLLYELLSGRHPFPGRKGLDMLYAVVHDAPVPLQDAAGDAELPPDLVTLVARAMHRDCAQRIASMADLAEALRAVEPARTPPGTPPRVDEARPVTAPTIAGPSHRPTLAISPGPHAPSFDSRVTTAQPIPRAEPAHGGLLVDPDAPPAPTPTVVMPRADLAPPAPATARPWSWRWRLIAVALVLVPLAYPLARGSEPPSTSRADASPASPAPPDTIDVPTRMPLARAEPPTLERPPLDPPAAELPAAELPAAELPAAELPAAELPAAELPAAEPPAAEPPAPTPERPRIPRSIQASIRDVQRKIQRKCHARLTREVVELDVWIDARTGTLRELQVGPLHERTSTRGCVAAIFAAASFPSFPGADYHEKLTVPIHPKAATPARRP